MYFPQKTQGLIFKKENLGETNQLFKVFTRDFGKLEILGKGIRKISSKLRSSIEIFYLSEIEFIQGKTYKVLINATAIEKFKHLRKSLKRLAIAYKIAEVLDSLMKGEEKDERIWNLILETFKNLDNPNLPFTICNLQYYYFFWNLISYLGHKPELYSCVLCEKKLKPKKIYFNEEEGGIVCDKCFLKTKKGKEIDPKIVKILRAFFEKGLDFFKKIKINKRDFQQLDEVSQSYLNFLTLNYETKVF